MYFQELSQPLSLSQSLFLMSWLFDTNKSLFRFATYLFFLKSGSCGSLYLNEVVAAVL